MAQKVSIARRNSYVRHFVSVVSDSAMIVSLSETRRPFPNQLTSGPNKSNGQHNLVQSKFGQSKYVHIDLGFQAITRARIIGVITTDISFSFSFSSNSYETIATLCLENANELAEAKSRSIEYYQQTLHYCQQMGCELESLGERILLLARLDAGKVAFQSKTIDLEFFLRSTWESCSQASLRDSSREAIIHLVSQTWAIHFEWCSNCFLGM